MTLLLSLTIFQMSDFYGKPFGKVEVLVLCLSGMIDQPWLSGTFSSSCDYSFDIVTFLVLVPWYLVSRRGSCQIFM